MLLVSDNNEIAEILIPTLSRDCLCQCREETQHRCWEQLDTDTYLPLYINIDTDGPALFN